MVAIPDPSPGLVIRYAYLWKREADRRRTEGSKNRPGVVVLSVTTGKAGGKTVWAAPITHTRPNDPEEAVEIPMRTGTRLGLDENRSWIVISEVNRFTWPGPDLRLVEPGRWAYGLLPAGLFRSVCERLADLARRRKVAEVRRDS